MEIPDEVIQECLDCCEDEEQVYHVLSAILLGEIIADILATPPVWRARWWQFWRPVKP